LREYSNKIAPFDDSGGQGMIRALVCGAAAAVFAAQAQAQDVAKAQSIASQVCAACHAADGNSIAPANPKIAGQIPEYLHKQLVDFKAQGGKKPARESPIMMGMVANLSDADMKGLAAFYGGQQLKPAAAADKNLAVAGQRLWRGGNATSGVPACAGCHGPAGAGIPAQYPRIAGQYADYIAAQLKAFKEGARANDPNGMMRGVAARLTDREIRAVAEYAAGLR
jgi:cytochrome c553